MNGATAWQTALLAIAWCALALADGESNGVQTKEAPRPAVTVDADGAVHLFDLTVPFSSFASPQAKAAYLERQRVLNTVQPQTMSIAEQRQWVVDYYTPLLEHARTMYPVQSAPATIGGVYTDVITPKEGVARKNKRRVLINLHGGGFTVGARIMGAMESVPVASLLKIKVIAVDYRMAPEHQFPAASEDVAAVYKELLKHYPARNIGIYGCSAGGVLTGEAVAWFEHAHLPLPGAIGIFCASAEGGARGDSSFVAAPLMGEPPPTQALAHPSVEDAAYFKDADLNDPLVSPLRSPAVLARFPPTLIVTSTRDPALSPAVYTHTQLVKLGVEAELHVWEGMIHGFFTTDPDLPESREAWDVVTRFFDRHLGAQ